MCRYDVRMAQAHVAQDKTKYTLTRKAVMPQSGCHQNSVQSSLIVAAEVAAPHVVVEAEVVEDQAFDSLPCSRSMVVSDARSFSV